MNTHHHHHLLGVVGGVDGQYIVFSSSPYDGADKVVATSCKTALPSQLLDGLGCEGLPRVVVEGGGVVSNNKAGGHHYITWL